MKQIILGDNLEVLEEINKTSNIGISNTGEPTEKLFSQITGATLTEKHSPDGDYVLDGCYGELKEASSTINQIRPVKYIPLVIHNNTPEKIIPIYLCSANNKNIKLQCNSEKDAKDLFRKELGVKRLPNGHRIEKLPQEELMPTILTDNWYVIPPNEIVHLASKLERGQHTENPFECCNLSITEDIKSKFKVEEKNLKQSILDANEQGKKHPELKIMMQNILADCKNMAQKHIRQVLQLTDIIGKNKINKDIINSY
jgi:hypothetical protein